MVFSSIFFIFSFLPVTIVAYYLAPKRVRNGILLLASLFFYAWGEPVYLFLMLYSILFNYVMGIDIARKQRRGKRAGVSLFFGVVVNLLILGFFKYYGFLAENIEALSGMILPKLELSLPIGLSFYTFQSLSYLVDVYRGKAQYQKNILSFGLYISMFPQLVAGPIVQYADIDAQLKERETSLDKFGQGVRYFIWGLGKKVLLANNLGVVYEAIAALPSLSVLSAWVGALAYTFQIYYDFSGYSDMAIGLGKMFGFELKENFAHPYCSRSITEFWRRWHITLGTWFREYVYIPLGGNRRGLLIQMRNIAIVWLLTGIWHGAAYNFILWGAYFGIILMIEKLFLLKFMEKWPAFFRHLYSLVLIVFGWVLFGFDELSMVAKYFGYLFGINTAGIVSSSSLFLLRNYALLLVIMAVASTPLAAKLFGKIMTALQDRSIISTVMVNVYNVAVFLMSVAYLVDATYNPFLYFRF